MMMIVTIPSAPTQIQSSASGSQAFNNASQLTEERLNITRDRGPVVDNGKRDLLVSHKRVRSAGTPRTLSSLNSR